MAIHWKPILVRLVEEEFERFKKYCREKHIKMVDLFRSSARLCVANPDIANGVLRVSGNGTDIGPVLDSIDKLRQKLEVVESKLSSFSNEKDLARPTAKNKMLEAILKIKHKAKKKVTTVDRLRLQLIKTEPSLAPFLVASANSAMSLFDEVLIELERQGELTRRYGGIIEYG